MTHKFLRLVRAADYIADVTHQQAAEEDEESGGEEVKDPWKARLESLRLSTIRHFKRPQTKTEPVIRFLNLAELVERCLGLTAEAATFTDDQYTNICRWLYQDWFAKRGPGRPHFMQDAPLPNVYWAHSILNRRDFSSLTRRVRQLCAEDAERMRVYHEGGRAFMAYLRKLGVNVDHGTLERRVVTQLYRLLWTVLEMPVPGTRAMPADTTNKTTPLAAEKRCPGRGGHLTLLKT